MGIFNKLKEANESRKEKNELRGEQVALQIVDYIGGYGEYKKSSGVLYFYKNQVEYKATLAPGGSFTIAMDNITDIAIEGKDEVSRRVTVTRLLLVGIFAFALKKKSKEKEAYITIVMDDGREAFFQVNKQSPIEIKAILSKVTLILRDR